MKQFIIILTILFTIPVSAQDPPNVLQQALGPLVAEGLSEEEAILLAEVCPQSVLLEVTKCLNSNDEAAAILVPAYNKASDLILERFGEKITQILLDPLLKQSIPQLDALVVACPEQDNIDARMVCILTAIRAAPAAPDLMDINSDTDNIKTGAGKDAPPVDLQSEKFPKEALLLLPVEYLNELPSVITIFFTPDDYTELKKACPMDNPETVVECLLNEKDGPSHIEIVYERAVITSMLSYMDAELPKRLSDSHIATLSEACDEPGNKWADCGFENPPDTEKYEACFELEDALAGCLVNNDLVTALYVDVQGTKKEAFGKALYVEFAGLLAPLTVTEIVELRKRCDEQEDFEKAAICISEDPLTKPLVVSFQKEAEDVMAGVKETVSLDDQTAEEYTDKFFYLFLTLPPKSLDSLANQCFNEETKLKEASDLDVAIGCIQQAADTDPIANPAYISKERLRSWIKIAREKVIEKLHNKETEKQGDSFNSIMVVLLILGLLGAIGILLMPLYLKKKYSAASSDLLWKSSAIAAGTFFITILLLGISLLFMRAVQQQVATDSTSPKLKVVEGAFDVLEEDEYVEAFSELSKERLDFIKTPMQSIVEDNPEVEEESAIFIAYLVTHWSDVIQEPELRHLAKNKDMLKSHVATFRSVISLYKHIDWFMSILPIIMSILAVVLYLMPLKDTLKEIATSPARAAQGNTSASDMLTAAKSTVWAEFKLILPYLTIILLFLPITGQFLSVAIKPLVEILLAYSLLTVFYVLFQEASSFVLYASLGSSMLLLTLCMAVYIAATVFFIGTVRKILRAKYHYGRTFGEFKKFWTKGVIFILLAMALPVIFVFILNHVAFAYFDPDILSLTSWDMIGIPLTALLIFPVYFWLARGWYMFTFVRKYPVPIDDPDAEAALMMSELSDE